MQGSILNMKLLLADDHTLFRDAVVQYIIRAEPAAEVLVAKDVHGAIELLEARNDIQLVLLDLRMPGMEGFSGLRKIREMRPGLSVALMSGYAEDEDIKQAVALGVRGYFPKTLSGQVMLSGIRRILEGDTFVAMDHNTSTYMPSYYDTQDKEANDSSGNSGNAAAQNYHLTPREYQVLQFLARGVSNKEIARALDLQIVTIKLHVRGICRKLNVQNRTQAALKAMETGLVSAEHATARPA